MDKGMVFVMGFIKSSKVVSINRAAQKRDLYGIDNPYEAIADIILDCNGDFSVESLSEETGYDVDTISHILSDRKFLIVFNKKMTRRHFDSVTVQEFANEIHYIILGEVKRRLRQRKIRRALDPKTLMELLKTTQEVVRLKAKTEESIKSIKKSTKEDKKPINPIDATRKLKTIIDSEVGKFMLKETKAKLIEAPVAKTEDDDEA